MYRINFWFKNEIITTVFMNVLDDREAWIRMDGILEGIIESKEKEVIGHRTYDDQHYTTKSKKNVKIEITVDE